MANVKNGRIVLLLHGIRTQAAWGEMVASVIETRRGMSAIPVKYGFFDTIRFLVPFYTRTAPVKRFLREYRDIRRHNPNAEISIIAHSFGTYIVSTALREPDVKFGRVILCGSIVKDDFRVADIESKIASLPVLNDCGTRDIWPVLAKSVTWGYGASGTFGFGTANVLDRFHRFTHSEYFDRDFVREFWLPFLSTGKIVESEAGDRTEPPFWQSLISIAPLKLVPLVVLAYLGFTSFEHWQRSKDFRMAIKSPIQIGHALGAPVVGIDTELINQSQKIFEISGISAILIGPNGKRIPLRVERTKAPGNYPFIQPMQMLAVTPTLSMPAQDRMKMGFVFVNPNPEIMDLGLKANQEFLASGKRADFPDPTENYFSQELLSSLRKVTDEKFQWEAGSWKTTLTYIANGNRKNQTVSFDISNADIQNIRSNIPYYKAGIGVFPNWQFLGPNGQLSISDIPVQIVSVN